ncbi:hypothetical protein Csa_016805 [Cucumis sativus]|uniref:Uncharacterized protein n=1 Tax=Cucumis sativus TaxID=3659 RepID=A0A0A0K6J2_CUCSA|nr:hypothetical protein Csa_016805 [Cucumis sativus]
MKMTPLLRNVAEQLAKSIWIDLMLGSRKKGDGQPPVSADMYQSFVTEDSPECSASKLRHFAAVLSTMKIKRNMETICPMLMTTGTGKEDHKYKLIE